MPLAFPVSAYMSLGTTRARVDLPGRIGEGGRSNRLGGFSFALGPVCVFGASRATKQKTRAWRASSSGVNG